MKFPAPEIVRYAIAYAILDAIELWVSSDEVPGRAWDKTLERYLPIFGTEAYILAKDVRDWFTAHGPYGGDVIAIHRRLMLALWRSERFEFPLRKTLDLED